MKYVQKYKKFSLITKVRQTIVFALMGLILFGISACGDEALDTSKFVSNQNNDFKLTLTISDDIVRNDDTIKLTAVVERLVDKTSISGSTPPTTMKMAVTGGSLALHSAGSKISEIRVILDDAKGSVFEALAFFAPSKSSSSGNVTASYNGINVSMSIDIVEPR